ncbi:hypothetical protein [Actinomadura sp. KC216]|nr:hypothetical protein [Actinomadura sp. KC216]
MASASAFDPLPVKTIRPGVAPINAATCARARASAARGRSP